MDTAQAWPNTSDWSLKVLQNSIALAESRPRVELGSVVSMRFHLRSGFQGGLHSLVPTLEWSIRKRSLSNCNSLAFSPRNSSDKVISNLGVEGMIPYIVITTSRRCSQYLRYLLSICGHSGDQELTYWLRSMPTGRSFWQRAREANVNVWPTVNIGK